MSVLLLGAGGSARAVAFHLTDHIGAGKLIIANRTLDHAQTLAREIDRSGRRATAIDETQLSDWAMRVGLIVNSTTKGQAGVRLLGDGQATTLVPYSALAPANPPRLPIGDQAGADFEQRCHSAARAEIAANNQASQALAQSIPPTTRFYDLIYHPAETVFLRHGRLSGHRTMNGQGMIVRQAALAFCKRICAKQLVDKGKNDGEAFRTVTEVMFRVW